MEIMDLSGDYHLSINRTMGFEPQLSIRKWYRVGEELRPGLPGIELSHNQFKHLSHLKDRLEDMSIRGTNGQCLLGGNRQVVVQGGDITLWRLPTVLGPIVALRHSLTMPMQLWIDVWRHKQWALAELARVEPDSLAEEAEPPAQPTQDSAAHSIDYSNSWWLGGYPADPEELQDWAAGLTFDQLMNNPDRQPAPWDDFWGAWQAVQDEIQKRLQAAPQPPDTPKRKRARKA